MSIDLEVILEDRVENNPEQFPRISDQHSYFKQYKTFSDYMFDQVHPSVTLGASAQDGGLLTDHGPEHIKTVIERVGYLLSNSHNQDQSLSGYEIYILLCAIHTHDVGNMYGRLKHEENSSKVLHKIRLLLGDNTSEIKIIRQIAQAHGGDIEGDKDTISALEGTPKLDSKPIRQKLLAAILRFGDELADDRRRASRFLNELELIPKEAEVFHAYAECLNTVSISPKEKVIDFGFEVTSSQLEKKYGKKDSNVFLLDEIFERTDKSFIELIYCSRFMRPLVELEAINVTINVNDPNNIISESIDVIPYRLEEMGYPIRAHKHISEICEALRDWRGIGVLTGKAYAIDLSEKQKRGALNGSP